MANVVRFKKRSVAASLSNYYARIYSKADGRIIYAGNGLSSDAQGNVTVDIGEAGAHGQHVNGFAGDVSDFVLALGSAFVSDADYNEGDAPLNKQAANIIASSVEEGNSVSARKGLWVSNDEVTYTYQWKLNGTDISGATTGSILTDESMIDGTLTCVVTATNKYGSTSSTTNGVSVTGEGGEAPPVDPSEPRFYWEMQSANQVSAKLDSKVLLGGDIGVKVKTYLTSGGVSTSILLGNSTDTSSILMVTATGKLIVRDDGDREKSSADGVYDFTQVNELHLEGVGGTYNLYLNDVLIMSSTYTTFTFDQIGRNAQSGYTQGYIYDIELEGITNQTYTNLSIPLDEAFSEDRVIHNAEGNVVGVKYNDLADDYATELPTGTAPTTEITFVKYTQLPDAQGTNLSGGFTNTGLFKLANGNWLIGNGGRATSDVPNVPSIVIVSPDFTTLIEEFDLSDPSLAGESPVQGVIQDNNGNYWVCANDAGKVLCIDPLGNHIDTLEHPTCNALAYDEVNDTLMVKSVVGGVVVYDRVSKEEVGRFDVVGTADHMHYSSSVSRLYCTQGGNGEDGFLYIYSLDGYNSEIISITTLPQAQAVEGVSVDEVASKVYISNDGGFHTNANPALSICIEYDILIP